MNTQNKVNIDMVVFGIVLLFLLLAAAICFYKPKFKKQSLPYTVSPLKDTFLLDKKDKAVLTIGKDTIIITPKQ